MTTSETPTPAETAAILDEAARLIEVGGWIQGEARNPRGRCILGAIGEATYVTDTQGPSRPLLRPIMDYVRAVGAVLRIVGDEVPSPEAAESWSAPLARWNDAPGRTQEDVLLALKRAAEDVRPKAAR